MISKFCHLSPIAGLFIPGASVVSKGIGAGIKTLVGATGGAIETTHQHASALDLHKIIGSFDASNPKSYEPVISAFRCGIFGFCVLSFPQNERKIYKLKQLSIFE